MARAVSLTRIAAVAVLCAATHAAHAQSARYPPDAADADREAEARSTLWESALDPERAPYEDLVRDGRRALDDQTDRGAQEAVDKLTDAIRRVPGDPRAYGWRGEAYLVLHDWSKCAADLAASEDRNPTPSPDRDQQELDLGICQARAGHYADAERTLVHAALRVPRGATWMRLGEVRIALGKLDEAIDALDAALDTNEGQSLVTRWLLALAYDRARRPTLAEEQGQLALARDISLGVIVNPRYPWLGPGEGDYLMGLAESTTRPGDNTPFEPEKALLYFRHFLAVAGDSPWRRRAEEHVRALEALPPPQRIDRNSGSSAIVDTATLRPALERAMPALRACVAKQPTAAYSIEITKDGPKTPASALDQAHFSMPPPGAKADLLIDVGDPTAAVTVAATRKCLEPIAGRVALPAPRDRDTWYRIKFVVIAP